MGKPKSLEYLLGRLEVVKGDGSCYLSASDIERLVDADKTRWSEWYDSGSERYRWRDIADDLLSAQCGQDLDEDEVDALVWAELTEWEKWEKVSRFRYKLIGE